MERAALLTLALAFGLVVACGTSSRDPGDTSGNGTQSCVPGATQTCACPGGSGAQSCNAGGTGFDACQCVQQVCTPGATQGCSCSDGKSGSQACNPGGTGYNACACSGTNPGGNVCSPGVSQACTCSTGATGAQVCNSQGAGFESCICSSGNQCLPAGSFCDGSRACCAGATCVNAPGVGTVCAAACTGPSNCQSGCCAATSLGAHLCTLQLFCADASSCSVAVGASCSGKGDAACCPDGNGIPSICSCVGADCSCKSLCVNNSQCTSGCCKPRSDGLLHCVPSSFCQ